MIAINTSKPKMIIPICLIVILLIGVIAGCTLREEQVTPLSAEELAYFNGDEFFNGEAYPNTHNQFLSSLYDSPEQIDLFQLFYCGSGLDENTTDEEMAAVIAANGWGTAPDCVCTKISRANMDAVLREYMGLALAETDGVGLENFTYLEAYDAYYYFHGDTNYRLTITFSRGEWQGDLIRLYYNDTFMADGNKVLTLREKNGNYLFIANQIDTSNPVTSVADPEGIIAADIEVPAHVLAAAKNFVWMDYQFWCNSSGYYRKIDGEIRMIGRPAAYDKWRIEGLSRIYTYTDLNGQALSGFQPVGVIWQALEVYQLDYRIHTLTPGLVVLSGAMDLDEDGWLLPTCPESTYLYFARINDEPYYLFGAMENDCYPGDEMFTSDLVYRLTTSKKAHAEALAHLQSLFADGETAIWYMAADGSQLPVAIPEEHAYVLNGDGPVDKAARYAVLFNCLWEPQDRFTYPSGAYLCLCDSPDACFQFFLGSTLVLWREGENVTAWLAGDNIYYHPDSTGEAALPDAIMRDFSGYEINADKVTIPAQADEAAADTVARFLAAYGEQLKNVAPENVYSITDFQIADIYKIETKDNRTLCLYDMAVLLPPEEMHQSTYWSGSDGEGELAGWLVMTMGIIIEQTDGVWHCTNFGTDVGML
jgi:hypothetical protein